MAGFASQNVGWCSLCEPDVACFLPGVHGAALRLL